MLPIGGRPLLEHTLALLKSHGVRDVAVNLNYKPEAITAYFAGVSSLSIFYSHEESILGTAGAARRLAPFLDSTFFLMYGDVLTDLDISALLLQHRSNAAHLTIVVYAVEDPARCGIVETGASCRVLSFAEKPANPTSNLSNAGIYVVEPSILQYIPEGFSDFGYDVIPSLIARRIPVYAYYPDQTANLLDIGSKERYAQACRDVEKGSIQLLSLE